jgi:beta-lactamase class A
MRILMMVDQRTLRRDQMIEVLPRDVWRCWPGDIGDSWPAKRKYTLDELLRLMVTQSDNTAVQTLFRIAGEREGMDAAFRKWKIDGFRVDRYEGQCILESHGVTEQPSVDQWQPNTPEILRARIKRRTEYADLKRFLADPRDTATPDSTVQLLSSLFNGSLLSASSTTQMIDLLKDCQTGENRIRGLLPPSVVVGDKTGTGATVGGLNGATNDVGLIMLGNGKALAMAVYIKGSTRDLATRERVIARMAKAAYDHWLP